MAESKDSRAALRGVRDLDVAACEANSLWNKLEAFKRSSAKSAGLTDADLKAAGIFVRESRDRFTDQEFRDLLDWYMCSDPWPVKESVENTSNSRMRIMLDDEAKARGYGNWVTAYHDKTLGDGPEASS